MYLPRTAVGGLMHEHQVILRVIGDIGLEAERLAAGESVDHAYIATTVDFIRTYADHCHHGKEEDILFRDLAAKPLSREDADSMARLIDDHVWARTHTLELVEAADRDAAGETDAAADVHELLSQLAHFYPDHIEREDHGLFKSVPLYFSRDELERMADECSAFERSLIHEKYLSVAESLEQRRRG